MIVVMRDHHRGTRRRHFTIQWNVRSGQGTLAIMWQCRNRCLQNGRYATAGNERSSRLGLFASRRRRDLCQRCPFESAYCGGRLMNFSYTPVSRVTRNGAPQSEAERVGLRASAGGVPAGPPSDRRSVQELSNGGEGDLTVGSRGRFDEAFAASPYRDQLDSGSRAA